MSHLVDWIYGNPTWLWGAVLVGLFTGVACIGLVLFRAIVPTRPEHLQNEVTGGLINIVGTAYAVLIAFIAVATWQALTDADKAVGEEASHVGNLYGDTLGLSQKAAKPIQDALKDYLDRVITIEWPAQRAGRTDADGGWEILRRVHAGIVAIEPETRGEAVIEAELLRTLNSVYTARRNRLLAAEGAIPAIVWWIIFIGSSLTVGYTYLFDMRDLRHHLLKTGSMAASMAVAIVLIVALDRPFRGDISVSTDAYENAKAVMGEMDKTAARTTLGRRASNDDQRPAPNP